MAIKLTKILDIISGCNTYKVERLNPLPSTCETGKWKNPLLWLQQKEIFSKPFSPQPEEGNIFSLRKSFSS